MKNCNNSGTSGKKYGAVGMVTEKEQKSEIIPTAPEQKKYIVDKLIL